MLSNEVFVLNMEIKWTKNKSKVSTKFFLITF